MCLVAFGRHLRKINGEGVMRRFAKSAKVLSDSLAPLLREGIVLASLRPLRIVDSNGKLVRPPPDLIAAVSRLTYRHPLEQQKYRAWDRPIGARCPPSTIAAWNGLLGGKKVRELPLSLIETMYDEILDLRGETGQWWAIERRRKEGSDVDDDMIELRDIGAPDFRPAVPPETSNGGYDDYLEEEEEEEKQEEEEEEEEEEDGNSD
jgi:hypothetical protein